jgi:hypothetical protein
MDKRDRFVSRLRKEASGRGLELKEEKARGKGGHSIIRIGSRWTTLPARDIDPKTARKIKKALGLE